MQNFDYRQYRLGWGVVLFSIRVALVLNKLITVRLTPVWTAGCDVHGD